MYLPAPPPHCKAGAIHMNTELMDDSATARMCTQFLRRVKPYPAQGRSDVRLRALGLGKWNVAALGHQLARCLPGVSLPSGPFHQQQLGTLDAYSGHRTRRSRCAPFMGSHNCGTTWPIEASASEFGGGAVKDEVRASQSVSKSVAQAASEGPLGPDVLTIGWRSSRPLA